MENITISDFNDICRTCLSKGELKTIYEKCGTDSVCIVEMLMSCTLVQFLEEELLPSKICLKCLEDIRYAFNFAIRCEKNDSVLRKILNDSNVSKKKVKCNKKQIIESDSNEERETIKKEEITSEIEDSTDFAFRELSPDVSLEEIENNENKNFYNTSKKQETNPNIENKSNITDTSHEPEIEIIEKSSNLEAESSECQENNDSKEKNSKSIKKEKKKKYECKRCCLNFVTFSDLKVHRLTVKHGKRNPCSICSKLISRRHMKVHFEVMHGVGERVEYTCEYCCKKFLYKLNLTRHIKRSHENQKFFCDLCGNGYTAKHTLNVHMNKQHLSGNSNSEGPKPRVSGPRKPRQRKGPPKSFVYTYPYFRCTYCRRLFDSEDEVNEHVKIHANQQQFLCSICGKTTTTKASLELHMKKHSETRPKETHVCNVCNRAFGHVSSLRNHMFHHKDKEQWPYSCSICGRKFIQQHNWQYHMRRHENITPFECPFCPKKFVSKDVLVVHKRIHTGETPHWCKVCEKGFFDVSRLKRHKCTGTKSTDAIHNLSN